MAEKHAPLDVRNLRAELTTFLNTIRPNGRTIGSSKYGIYAFYDYDGEPIYVGQTSEKLATRIRRHLTNQRTDAVAMGVLDPFEVADVEAWPIDDQPGTSMKDTLNRAEFTVFQKLIAESQFSAILNEKGVAVTDTMTLPQSFRRRIVPADVFELRRHSDVRIARRAGTIATLARVISERRPSDRLRVVLLTQARRLEHLTRERLDELGIDAEHPSDNAHKD